MPETMSIFKQKLGQINSAFPGTIYKVLLLVLNSRLSNSDSRRSKCRRVGLRMLICIQRTYQRNGTSQLRMLIIYCLYYFQATSEQLPGK
jgi:hypothetical protein